MMKKRSERLSFFEPIQFRVKNGFLLHGCVAKDISDKGLRVRLEKFLALGTDLELKIQLQQRSEPILAMGKIKWIKQLPDQECFEAGIDLIIDKGSLKILEHLLPNYDQIATKNF